MLLHGNTIYIFKMFVLKIKVQLLDASSMITIWFNITKFDNHDCTIFWYYGHENNMEWHKGLKSCLRLNGVNYEFEYSTI
jgi:hypothetical protein